MTLRTCIVALNAYPAIDPEIPGPIGGIETRAWTLAQGLARRPDCEVSFAVRHSKPLRKTEYNRVQLRLVRDHWYAAKESLALRLRRCSRFPYIEWKHPRISDLATLAVAGWSRWKRRHEDLLAPMAFYQQIPSDVFLTFGVQGNSARVISSAHATGRPAVLFLSSDGDLDERYLSGNPFVSKYHDHADVCRWIIDHADHILCQTEWQQKQAKRFGRDATLLRNPIDLEWWDQHRHRDNIETITHGLQRYVLWVGRAEDFHKCPAVAVEIARRTPEVDYLMILNRRDDVVERQVRQSAPPNLRIIERVSFPEMPAVMQRAAALLNTSRQEGFPNTFLQAAASGVPVASLKVESEMLANSKAGFCGQGNLETLTDYVRRCWKGRPEPFDAPSARSWVETHHDLNAQSVALEQILRQVVEKHKRGQ